MFSGRLNWKYSSSNDVHWSRFRFKSVSRHPNRFIRRLSVYLSDYFVARIRFDSFVFFFFVASFLGSAVGGQYFLTSVHRELQYGVPQKNTEGRN